MNLTRFFGTARVLGFAALWMTQSLLAQPEAAPAAKFWRPNGPVNTILVASNTVFIGGDFNYVGPSESGVGVLSLTSGQARRGFPLVDGQVHVAIPDGAGGWYLGGAFTTAGGVTRGNAARILPDHQVDPSWKPALTGTCRAMVRAGDTIFLGGNFTRVNGVSRANLAAVDARTGELTAWPATANSGVNALALDGEVLYAGGNFTSISSQTRTRLAAIEAATGAVLPWNPGANNIVNALAVTDSAVYVGGSFTSAGTKPRNRLAAIPKDSGVALDWNPNASAVVNAILLHAGSVFVGGNFTSVGGLNRGRVAALDPATGLATDWNVTVPAEVLALGLAGDDLVLAGEFASVNSLPRNGVARVNATTGELAAWGPLISTLVSGSSAVVSTLSIQNDSLLVAGSFLSLGGVTRSNLTAISTVTGEATDWNPAPNGRVTALGQAGDAVYVGGAFTEIGGAPRTRLAAVDSISGAVSSWKPDVLGRSTVRVSALVPDLEGRLYVGGNFTNIMGVARTSLAAFDRGTGELLDWNPVLVGASASLSASVNAIVPTAGLVYIGGDFTQAGGQARQRLATLQVATGRAGDWNPGANAVVNALVVSGSRLYAGGLFTTIAGLTRGKVAQFDFATGEITPWNPDASGTSSQVYDLLPAGNSVYVAGEFSQVGGEFRNRLGAVGTETVTAKSWNPNLNRLARALGRTPHAIVAGGDFTTAGASPASYLAVFDADPAFDPVSLRYTPGGQFTATVRQGEGLEMRIQASSDLVNWTDVSTNIVTGVPLQFSHTPLPSQPNLVYRAVLKPE